MKAHIPGAAPLVATAAEYRTCFEMSKAGELVLQDLVNRFCGSTYVRGGLEAQRETDFRSGRREVVEFILRQINSANGADTVQPPDEEQ
jgi:hypothetical protein